MLGAMADRWKTLVDERYPAERSLLLRYHRVLERLDSRIEIPLPELEACSITEGATISFLAEHRGVEIQVCDESSLMTTGTYKDLDACLTTAIARRAGIAQVVVSSGGNLGCALSAYGERAGLRSFFFHPRTTLYKLDAASFAWGGARLICADLPERQVKSLALAFARRHGLSHVPDVRWRLAASAVRALFLLEQMAGPGGRVDAIAQAVCAGYGPVGIYGCWSMLAREGLLSPDRAPRFFGFQQEANAPMARAFHAGDRELDDRHVQPRPEEYIEPGLYNASPRGTYPLLYDLVTRHGGDVGAISAADYAAHRDRLIEWFRGAGHELTRAPGRGDEILEKAGLLAGVGILKAIEAGQLRPGERVLWLLTGGFRKVRTAAPPVPDAEVDASLPEQAWVEELGRRFGLSPIQRAVLDAMDAAVPASRCLIPAGSGPCAR